ncbi:uncharacterized protein LY79DRAFT_577573 [Colletotrichum navitas]|uniref:Uncharacterized protein n=1 Tax=Colletotrichum navitas TaxID=681940 RepID=A0AAD8Q5L7_9PEZI|nr:uncharacterized protein LY79DRAFT_577573 [Colletotrichum navitas]KAK1596095.1 hypothetical protein LY79DRAFT_577573 [Colletotrichum navitas]
MAPAPEAPRLPASADFNAIYNRISLASAKQATFLASMRAKYPSLARPASVPPSSSAVAANGTFSSLAKPDPSSDSRGPAVTPRGPRDDDIRLENPNAGLGYAAPKSENAASAATRDLSRRLLGGKRGRADDSKAAAAALAKRRLQDDESEEEEGRSGLGRSKKRRVRQETPEAEPSPTTTTVPAPEPENNAAEDERADVAMRETAETENGEESSSAASAKDAAATAVAAAAPVGPAGPDNRPATGETSKKRRKKNRNKQNKAAAKAAADGTKEDD